jgi:hypothetical protein
MENTFYTDFRLSGTEETEKERAYIYNKIVEFSNNSDGTLADIGLVSDLFSEEDFDDGEIFFNGCYGRLDGDYYSKNFISFHTETRIAPSVGFFEAMIDAIINDYTANDNGTLNFDNLGIDCKWEYIVQDPEDRFFVTNIKSISNKYCLWIVRANELLDECIYQATEDEVQKILSEALEIESYSYETNDLLRQFKNSKFYSDIIVKPYNFIEIDELEEMFL